MSPPSSLTAFLLVAILVSTASAQSIGVNYGSVADNVPRSPQVAAFVRDQSFKRILGRIIHVVGGVVCGAGQAVGMQFCNQATSVPSPPPSVPLPPIPSSSVPSPPPPPSIPSPSVLSPSPPSPTTGMTFCVANTGASEEALQSNINYACGIAGVDCSAIQSGGPCFDPNNIQSHATYAMNAYYQKSSRQNSDCDFNGTGVLTTADPSSGTCTYST